MKDVYAINRIHFTKRVESDNVSLPLVFVLTWRLRRNMVVVITTVVGGGELEIKIVDKKQKVLTGEKF